MARQEGTFDFSANFETKIEGTLDARQLVDDFADLLNFTSDDFIPNGFPVSVKGVSTVSERGIYLCIDNQNLDQAGSWLKVGANGSVDLTDYLTETEINNLLNDKVDKVSGKGLSEEDYTTSDKNRLLNTSGTNTGDQDISGISDNANAISSIESDILDFETTTELNARDVENRDRANHTGTQNASTITGLSSVAISGDYDDLTNKPLLAALAFLNTISTSEIDNDAVTFAKLQNLTAHTLLGRAGSGNGDANEIGLNPDTLLARVGSGSIQDTKVYEDLLDSALQDKLNITTQNVDLTVATNVNTSALTNGRRIVIDNGVNDVTVTVDTDTTDLTFEKTGSGTVDFVAATGQNLDAYDGIVQLVNTFDFAYLGSISSGNHRLRINILE